MGQLSPEEIASQQAHIHDDRSNDIIISHAICLSLALIAIVLRFLSRHIGKVRLEPDDWMIVASFIFASGEVACGLLAVHYGGGKHAILVTDPIAFAKVVLATEVLYNPSIACVKFSILLLYRRIFPSRAFRRYLYVVGAIIFTYSWINVITAIFQCRPIAAAWDLSITNATCVQLNIEIVVFAVLNCVTDLTTICLPMPILWRLQIPLRRRLQLVALFLAGGFVCIVGIYRIPTQAAISLSDASWSDVNAAVWSVVEVCIGIVSACLPTYRPLFLKWFGKSGATGNKRTVFSLLETDEMSRYRSDRRSAPMVSKGSHAFGEEGKELIKPQKVACREGGNSSVGTEDPRGGGLLEEAGIHESKQS